MKKDIVIVTCHRRPELFYHCLRYLAENPEVRDRQIKVWVAPDNRWNLSCHAGIFEVTKEFESLIDIELRHTPQHRYPGNSYNTLFHYRTAMNEADQFVYLVEEDVMVANDFFKWHRLVHQVQGIDLFCSVSVLNQRRNDWPQTGNLEDFYLSKSDYASLGVCFPKGNLFEIIQHAKMNYFERMRAYVDDTFPKSRFRREFCEQDGLILRIIEKNKGCVAWPVVPRAFHAGWFGYNRTRSRPLIPVDYRTRIGILEHILEERPHMLREMSKDFDDIRPCSLRGHEFDKVQMVCQLP